MNPIMQKIKNEILNTPEIKNHTNSTRGYVSSVYYDQRKCDIIYWLADGTKRRRRMMDFPKDNDGVYHQSLKIGDTVELTFKGKTQEGLFISGVRKKTKVSDLDSEKGQDLPLSTGLF